MMIQRREVTGVPSPDYSDYTSGLFGLHVRTIRTAREKYPHQPRGVSSSATRLRFKPREVTFRASSSDVSRATKRHFV